MADDGGLGGDTERSGATMSPTNSIRSLNSPVCDFKKKNSDIKILSAGYIMPF